MLVKSLLPAFVAIGSAAAQSATCTVSTTTINSQAEATGLAGCRTVRGTVVIGTAAGPNIDISGPREITGDLRVLNNGVIEGLSSSDLTTVGGSFTMNNVTKLIRARFPSLNSVKGLAWQSITNLETIELGPLTKAEEVSVSDTFLRSLDGINLSSARKVDINNNRRLTKFESSLGNLSDNLNINANGLALEVTLPNLVWIANMTISNVTKFAAPSLKVVNGSARFDSNYFESFSAPNLTHTESGDISFVGNPDMLNVTFPQLTTVAGGLLIANNTALTKVSGFPQLKTVGGAVKLRGNFTTAEFPKLEDVKGAFDVSSTADISKSCDKFNEQKGIIQGTYSCTSNNAKANEDTDSTASGGSTSDSNSSGDKNGAASMALNTALFGLVAVAGLAAAL